ncbi:MAG: 16S rRNA (adenine(1518)-N(6)/adenine(1519)-N(6))-dimethyltransferase RsmA [Chloroflexi bacterium]|nr:MAG: 16S rRNA (adenine(1518)-N(6)/adenine(1519)-N(6))-dimethyltransferase RsmA [Chloroflexota bacterium]
MKNVRRLLDKWDIRPSKGLGQNFLVNQTTLEKIVAAAELAPHDVVLEVGPGLGTLTRRLAREAKHVVAVELDQRLIPVLQSELSNLSNVTLIQGDILAFDPAILVSTASGQRTASNTHYKVVANLPYYITSAIVRHLLEASLKPQRMVITVQREVAERIVAEPGRMSLLAVSVQFYGQPRLLFRIKPGNFYPSPDVESAIVRIDLHPTLPLSSQETPAFFRVVRSGFSQRRKQLHNALAAGLGKPSDAVAAQLSEAGVDPHRRAQSLSIEEWVRITRALSEPRNRVPRGPA